ncbi:MAG: hypothetical protein E7Z93_07355 [Cyanobacteria bacterium SIG32]|nr:hypothetical protein [Cyanobacteria bacterium SIG32]
MTILRKPYKQEDYTKLVEECNQIGNKRIELHQGNAYALFDYEKVENGEIIDLRDTDEYKAEQAEKLKYERTQEIMTELDYLDKKRIRAICEPETVRDDGKTWLEYYNEQISILREELALL